MAHIDYNHRHLAHEHTRSHSAIHFDPPLPHRPPLIPVAYTPVWLMPTEQESRMAASTPYQEPAQAASWEATPNGHIRGNESAIATPINGDGSAFCKHPRTPPSPIPSSPSSYVPSPPTPCDLRMRTAYFNDARTHPADSLKIPAQDPAARCVVPSQAPQLVPFTLDGTFAASQLHRAHAARASELYALKSVERAPPERKALAARPRPAPLSNTTRATPRTRRAPVPLAAHNIQTAKREPVGRGRLAIEHAARSTQLARAPFVPTCAADLEAPPVPSDVPLRATGAPPVMRRMMGAFRLDPFALHDGVHAALRPGAGGVLQLAAGGEERDLCWNGEEAGPLKKPSALVEFQVNLEDPDALMPNQVRYPHLFPATVSPPSSPEVARLPTVGLYTLEPEGSDDSDAPLSWALAGTLAPGVRMSAPWEHALAPDFYDDVFGSLRQSPALPGGADGDMLHPYLHPQRPGPFAC